MNAQSCSARWHADEGGQGYLAVDEVGDVVQGVELVAGQLQGVKVWEAGQVGERGEEIVREVDGLEVVEPARRGLRGRACCSAAAEEDRCTACVALEWGRCEVRPEAGGA